MTYFADKFLMVGLTFSVHLVLLWKDVYSSSILQFHLQVHNVRKTFVEVLKEKFKDYSLTFSIGGQISFDVSLVHSSLYSLFCSHGQVCLRAMLYGPTFLFFSLLVPLIVLCCKKTLYF